LAINNFPSADFGSPYGHYGGKSTPGGGNGDAPGAAFQPVVASDLPQIISRGEKIRAAVGERVTLPCQVKNLGKLARSPFFRGKH